MMFVIVNVTLIEEIMYHNPHSAVGQWSVTYVHRCTELNRLRCTRYVDCSEPRSRRVKRELVGLSVKLPNKASLDVHLSIRTYVRPSVRPTTKSFADLNEIWCVGRG